MPQIGLFILLKKRLGRTDQIILRHSTLARLCAGPEVVTKIRSVFFADHVGLSFPTFVVGLQVMMFAVFARVQIRPAFKTFVPKADLAQNRLLGLAFETKNFQKLKRLSSASAYDSGCVRHALFGLFHWTNASPQIPLWPDRWQKTLRHR